MQGKTKKRGYIALGFLLVVFICHLIYRNGILPLHAQTTPASKVLGIQNKVITTSFPSISSTPTPTMMPTATPTASLTPPPVYTGYCVNVPVLMYHHIQPGGIAKQAGQSSLTVDNNNFGQQMAYLTTHGYTILFAEDLVNDLRNHTPPPPKSIVITIDDGYQDIYDYAYPILKQYHIKATLMIPTGLMNVSSASNAYLTWGELKEMMASGLISVANHTWSHYAMGTKSADKDQFEVSTAQNQLLSNIGKSITIFAYPYGTGAAAVAERAVLQKNGIVGAFSTIGGTTQCDSFIYSLHRTRIGSTSFPAYGIQ